MASWQQNVCAMVGFSVAQSAIFVQRLVTWDNEAFQNPTTAQTQTLPIINTKTEYEQTIEIYFTVIHRN
ncbi:MAG: hypothetical protein RIB47_01155 [Cyclobacteriaceae bacterium]